MVTVSDTDERKRSPTDSEIASSFPKNRLGLFLLISLCGVGFFLADVATAIYFEHFLLAMFFLGIVVAQLTVICVWGTLVQGTFWLRLPWTLLLLVLSWCGFAWGIQLSSGRNIDAMLGVASIWALGFITSFVPLKIAAIAFRWRITQHSTGQDGAAEVERYSIRDLMIGTLLLAISMAIARAMLAGEEDITIGRALVASDLNEPEALIVISVFGLVSLLVKLPCIWISLAERRNRIASRIGWWVLYCFGLAILEIMVFAGVFGAGIDGEFGGGVILGHQVMGAVTLFVCLCLRGLGYRLTRVRKETRRGASAV